MSAPSLIGRLMQFRSRILDAPNPYAAQTMFVNALHNIVPYDQAVFWADPSTPSAISAIGKPDPKTPHVQQLQNLFKRHLKSAETARSLTASDLASVASYRDLHGVWVPLNNQSAGVLLTRTDPAFSEAQIQILEFLASSLVQKMVANPKSQSQGNRKSAATSWVRRLVVLGCVIGALYGAQQVAIPQSVLAPAEIVSRDIFFIKAPTDGFVQDVLVDPGEHVTAGQTIAKLDKDRLSASLEIAQAEERKLRVEYEQESLKAFASEQAQTKAADIQGRLEEKREQIRFIESQLTRFDIKTPKAGQVILQSVQELRGRPVQTGETLLQVVDPQSLEINAWMNVQNALDVSVGDDITLFLSADPFNPVTGRVIYMNPQATQRQDGTVGYLVRAEILETPATLALGGRGRARITSGETTVLGWLTRKPVAWIRQTVGI